MISKKDIDNIKLLKKVLDKKEFLDFVNLLNKNVKAKIKINGNITISYYDNNDNLLYTYEIEKAFLKDKELTFEISLSKTTIRKLIKLLENKEIENLIKNCDYVILDKNNIRINKKNYEISLIIMKKFKILKPFGNFYENSNDFEISKVL